MGSGVMADKAQYAGSRSMGRDRVCCLRGPQGKHQLDRDRPRLANRLAMVGHARSRMQRLRLRRPRIVSCLRTACSAPRLATARHEPFCKALQRQTWDIRPGYGLQLDQRRLSRRAVFKGISHDGFGLVFGTEPAVLAAIAVAQAALCGLPRAYQGKTSVVQGGVIGFVFGAGSVTLGTLWPFVIAHGLIGAIGLTALSLQANRTAPEDA